jgi:sialic acid synthase SpsE
MAQMRIGNRSIDKDTGILMLAEEGQANQGDPQLAVDMCKIAAIAGADGIEFQFFLADDMYVCKDPGHLIYSKRELSSENMKHLIEVAHENGLIFQVAGLSPRIIELCADWGTDSFCVNATDLTNPFIIDAVASTGKPFWLATLMATIEEIDWAVEYVRSKKCSNFGILHGQHVMSSDSTRGVPPELLQLDCIEMFKQRYGTVVGFVDHTATTFVPTLAAAKGASVVMKHLAPKKAWEGPDSVVCLNPEQWLDARNMVRYAALAGGMSKELSQAEFKDRSIHRRSLYTARSLPAGHELSSDDIVALRPGLGGIDPRHLYKQVIGKRLSRMLPEQHQLHPDEDLI